MDSARNSENGEEEWKQQGSFVISAPVSSVPGAFWISSKADLKQTSRNLNVKLDAASVSKFQAQEAFVCYYSFSVSMVTYNVCVSFSISDLKEKTTVKMALKVKRTVSCCKLDELPKYWSENLPRDSAEVASM